MTVFNIQYFIKSLPYVFLILAITELLFFLRKSSQLFSWKDWLTNIILFSASVKLFNYLLIPLQQNWFNSFNSYLFSNGLKLIANKTPTLFSLFIAFLLIDFIFYVQHYACHKIRFLWCIHVVHHSSEFLNLSTQYRHSIFGYFTRLAFFIFPLSWLGFYPTQISIAIALNFFIQAILHTQAINKLGLLEFIFNTPSHHRVHHGTNSQYLDKNFASALIIWDKIFKTFAPEIEPVKFGITKKIDYTNVFKANFDEWKDLLKDVWNSKNISDLIKSLVTIPGKNDL